MTEVSSVSSVPKTLTALLGERVIHFTDFIHEGERVEVYRTIENAQEEIGPSDWLVVRRDEDDWWLESA